MPGLSPRQQQLSSLAAQVPVQNQQLVQQQQATQAIQMQQALGQAPASSNIRATSAAFGAQQAQQQGKQQVGVAQQTTQQLGQIQNQQNQELERVQNQALQEKSLANKRTYSSLTNQLAGLSEQVKSSIFDREMQFREDELGRSYWSERQLMDWKISEAKSDEELYEFQQQVQQTSERKMQILRTAHAKVMQELEQSYSREQQGLNQAQAKELMEAKVELEDKIRRQQARAQQNSMILSSGLSIIAGAAAASNPVTAPFAPVIMAGAAGAGQVAAAQGAKVV